MEYSTWGLATRKGKTKYNSTELSGATSIRGLHTSYATGSRFILAADDQGIIYKDNGTGTFSSIHTDTTADSYWHFEDWLTYTFWCNGTDELWRYDGSNIDEMTNAPTGLAGVVNVENRLFGWKTTDNNLYFCDIRTPNTWDTASEYSGFVVIPQVKGDFPIACARQGKYIIVFKSNSNFLVGKPMSDLKVPASVLYCVVPSSQLIECPNDKLYVGSIYTPDISLPISKYVSPEPDPTT